MAPQNRETLVSKPRIAITMGDPAGIGPELCLLALNSGTINRDCVPIVFGDSRVLRRVAEGLGQNFRFPDVSIESVGQMTCGDEPVIVDAASQSLGSLQPGAIDATTGKASFDFVTEAISSVLSGRVDAVVTAPIHKEAWAAAEISYLGHTELFADRCHAEKFCMMMTSPKLTCSLVTTHIGLSAVPTAINTARVSEVIELTHAALQRICGRSPRLTVLGLNPHAGEGGLFGNREEETLILPAIQAAASKGIQVEGPIPADTAFLPWLLEETDGYICMYHDQGLIPFKTLAFDTGVNTTLGLPVIRTSVDHGTALDIAWQGKADPASLFAAIELAVQLCG